MDGLIILADSETATHHFQSPFPAERRYRQTNGRITDYRKEAGIRRASLLLCRVGSGVHQRHIGVPALGRGTRSPSSYGRGRGEGVFPATSVYHEIIAAGLVDSGVEWGVQMGMGCRVS